MLFCSCLICAAATLGGLRCYCQTGVNLSVLCFALSQAVLHDEQSLHLLVCHTSPAPLSSQIYRLQGFFYKQALQILAGAGQNLADMHYSWWSNIQTFVYRYHDTSIMHLHLSIQ